jgi:hypothetical protein
MPLGPVDPALPEQPKKAKVPRNAVKHLDHSMQAPEHSKLLRLNAEANERTLPLIPHSLQNGPVTQNMITYGRALSENGTLALKLLWELAHTARRDADKIAAVKEFLDRTQGKPVDYQIVAQLSKDLREDTLRKLPPEFLEQLATLASKAPK